jgi:hypothetical protein
MKGLFIDELGRPVPWFVDYLDDGKPEFRSMDGRKYGRAIKEKLCWVCGNPLKGTYVFVAGCMCGINRTSAEPPSHPDCARWSARNCPFLANPNMVRREDEIMDNNKLREAAAGFAIARNPGVTLLWFTREYEVFNAGGGKPLIQMGRPSGVEFYHKGKPATLDEIEESIAGGIGLLEAVARTEPGGIEALRRAEERFRKLLPKK